MWISNDFGEIFHQLTKIADWLFSFQGCEALASCRNVLEELGLISWREETGCVHIHGLTLEGVRRMLSENHLSLYKLLSSLEYKTPTPDVEVRLATRNMSRAFFSFLTWDVLSSTIAFLHKTSQLPINIDTSETSAEILRVIDFLSPLLDNNAISQVGISALSKHDEAKMVLTGRSMVVSCLMRVGIQITPHNYCFQDARLKRWLRLYLTFPLNETESHWMHLMQSFRRIRSKVN